MSTTLISPAVAPSFAMPTCGHAVVPTTGITTGLTTGIATSGQIAWPTPSVAGASTDLFGGADRSYALVEGVVAFANKRRTTLGSLSWSTTDC